MKREKNKLVFQPEEEEKFLRAVRLYSRLCGNSAEEAYRNVAHERAHIGMYKTLGIQNKILRYELENDGVAFFYCVRNDNTLTDRENVLIKLAPEEPSWHDFMTSCFTPAQNDKMMQDQGKYLYELRWTTRQFRDYWRDYMLKEIETQAGVEEAK